MAAKIGRTKGMVTAARAVAVASTAAVSDNRVMNRLLSVACVRAVTAGEAVAAKAARPGTVGMEYAGAAAKAPAAS